MNITQYDTVKKECKICGCLLPNTEMDIKYHTCSPYYFENKLKELFGQKPLKEEIKFKIGQEVSAEMMGIIDWVYPLSNGDIMYRVIDEEKNIHGFFLQSQITKQREE